LLAYSDADSNARELSYSVDELSAALALREETLAALIA